MTDKKLKEVQYPYEFFFDGAADIKTKSDFHQTDYQMIASDIFHLLEEAAPFSDDSPDANEKRGSVAGCLVRVAGHDFMDYRIGGGGGSDACFDLNDADNEGLEACLKLYKIPDLYKNVTDKVAVSLADFFIIAGESAAGRLADDFEMDGEDFKKETFMYDLMHSFKYGRTTAKSCAVEGRMPNAENGCFGKGEGADGLK